MGRVAALKCFVSKATGECLPFFNTLKQAFVWIDECETAFQELNRYLSNPSLLSLSKEGKDLFLYLVIFATMMSAAWFRKTQKSSTQYTTLTKPSRG